MSTTPRTPEFTDSLAEAMEYVRFHILSPEFPHYGVAAARVDAVHLYGLHDEDLAALEAYAADMVRALSASLGATVTEPVCPVLYLDAARARRAAQAQAAPADHGAQQ